MSQKSKKSLVDEAVGLLVKHFGIVRIQDALARVSNGATEISKGQERVVSSKLPRHPKPTIVSTLEQLCQTDEEKYNLLNVFYLRLKNSQVLPESQDIRQFAQLIGLKNIEGKSRKDLIPKLVRFLIELPTERLKIDLEKAPTISEEQRQQGFSVLTDKLLGDK